MRNIATEYQLNLSSYQTLFIVLGFKEELLPGEGQVFKARPGMYVAEVYTLNRGKIVSVKKVC